MKNTHSFLLLMALMVLASCGTTSYYTISSYDDGIYTRPDREAIAQLQAAKLRAEAETRKQNELLAQANDDIYALADDETYESRLKRFSDDDEPYVINVNYYGWDTPWYNPWWGNRRWYSPAYYGFYGYAFATPWLSSWYGWYDPWYWGGWYDPWYYPSYAWGWHDPWIGIGGHHPHPGLGHPGKPGNDNGMKMTYAKRASGVSNSAGVRGGSTYRRATSGTSYNEIRKSATSKANAQATRSRSASNSQSDSRSSATTRTRSASSDNYRSSSTTNNRSSSIGSSTRSSGSSGSSMRSSSSGSSMGGSRSGGSSMGSSRSR